MRYIAKAFFDDGFKRYIPGEEYNGPSIAQLLQSDCLDCVEGSPEIPEMEVKEAAPKPKRKTKKG